MRKICFILFFITPLILSPSRLSSAPSGPPLLYADTNAIGTINSIGNANSGGAAATSIPTDPFESEMELYRNALANIRSQASTAGVVRLRPTSRDNARHRGAFELQSRADVLRRRRREGWASDSACERVEQYKVRKKYSSILFLSTNPSLLSPSL